MELAKRVYGIETEYGILLREKGTSSWIEPTQITLDQFFSQFTDICFRQEVLQANPHLWISNGARLYQDNGMHPEYATPECISPEDAIRCRVAGDMMLERVLTDLNRSQPRHELVLFRSNIGLTEKSKIRDVTAYNSFGTHINISYTDDTVDTVLRAIHRQLIAGFFAAFCASASATWDGSGWLRIDSDGMPYFTLSQRLWFMDYFVSNQTTSNRALGNLREEDHTPNFRFKRYHSISGDTHRVEYIDLLRLALMGLLMGIAEAGIAPAVEFASLQKFRRNRVDANLDHTLQKRCWVTNKGKLSSLDIQELYLKQARFYYEGNAEAEEILNEWEHVLNVLRDDTWELSHCIEWQVKYNLFTIAAKRMKLQHWSKARGDKLAGLVMLEHVYGQLNRRSSYSVGVETGWINRVFSDAEVRPYVFEAPNESRGIDRGKLISLGKRFPNLKLTSIDWQDGRFSYEGSEERSRIPKCGTICFMGYPNPVQSSYGGDLTVDKLEELLIQADKLEKELRRS